MYRTPYASNQVIADIRGAADIIDEVDELTTYMGFCFPGTTGTDEPKWSIMKIVQSGIETPVITTFKWAGGTCSYNHIWDNRAALEYSFKNF